MLKLENITSYKLSSELSDKIWKIVINWSVMAQKTIGQQLIRSVDSISANIAEGEGRYFKKDKMKFFYQARGSLYETNHWINKAKERKLLTEEEYLNAMKSLRELPKEINYLIANISRTLKK